jgi:hypothetical protein
MCRCHRILSSTPIHGSHQKVSRLSLFGAVAAPMAAAKLYRLRLITADPLSLRNRTVCDLPCKTTLITPEIPYSLL